MYVQLKWIDISHLGIGRFVVVNMAIFPQTRNLMQYLPKLQGYFLKK